MKILNFGSCNIDWVYGVEHIVRPAETIHVEDLHRYAGGKGLNQTIAVARANGSVFHAGCIGEDGFFLKELMEKDNVNTEYLQVVPERTGHAMIQVDEAGQNSILVYGGANKKIDQAYVDEVLEQFDEGDFLILQNEINNVEYIIDRAFAKKMQIVLNPSPCNRVMELIDLNKITYLILNEIEAGFFSKKEKPYASILQLSKDYPNLCIVLTLGEKGCLYTDHDKIAYHPAFKTKVVDTTAAGDTFAGYFVSGLSKDLPLCECIRVANAAASIAIRTKGAAPSIPVYDYVMRKIDLMELDEGDSEYEQI